MSEHPDHRLLEAVADIAYDLGASGYYGGDYQEDIAMCIRWGIEFIEIHPLSRPLTMDKFIREKVVAEIVARKLRGDHPIRILERHSSWLHNCGIP